MLAVAILAAVTGPHLANLAAASTAACTAHGDCASAIAGLLAHDAKLRLWLGAVVLIAPCVVGVFWGAPLVARELETGTHRLAWTQSVTRGRWMWAKLAVVGTASVAVVGLLSLTVTLWAHPLDRVDTTLWTYFDQRDIVPPAYAAFAFALGVTAGVLIRRTVPAMAATLVGYVGARLAMTYVIRPALISPEHTTAPLRAASGLGFTTGPGGGPLTFVASAPSIPNAWVYSTSLADRTGHTVATHVLQRFLQIHCPTLPQPPGAVASGARRVVGNPDVAFNACVSRLAANFHLLVSAQPASRYWPFQWYETGIFLAAAAALAVFSHWWTRHRLA